MPWGIEDVDRFKKGLSQKQKEQWVAVANSVLEQCIKAGGTEEECAPKAIKQANAVVGEPENLNEHYSTTQNFSINNYVIKREVHQDKKHIVVPVVMMVEGVHNGSAGPIFHSIEELGKFPEAWNGIPVTLHHPTDGNTPISANSPAVIDKWTIGRVYNTRVEGKKLKAEAWLDEEKIRKVYPQLLDYLEKQLPVDVSVGVFTEEEKVAGEWNGEQYSAIARNHRPDHLAILPGGVGACSWEDGCGIRAYWETGEELDAQIQTIIKEALKGVVSEDVEIYIKRADKEGIAEKNDSKEETQEKENSKGGVPTTMSEEKTRCPSIQKLFDFGVFKEADEEWLTQIGKENVEKLVSFAEALQDTQAKLQSLQEQMEKEKEQEKEPQVNVETAIQVLREFIKKPEDLVEVVPEELKDAVKEGLKLHQEKRDSMIKDIADYSDAFTKEELEQKSMAELEKLHKLIPKTTVYSVQGVEGKKKLETNAEILLPLGVEEKK